MAVWIGGVIAELDLLRRASLEVEGFNSPCSCGECACDECTCGNEPRAEACDCKGCWSKKSLCACVTCSKHSFRGRRAQHYRSMLDEAGYKKVEFDILAGASAGGLNAVLFALAQSYGVATDDIVLETWQDNGGLWDLLRDPGVTTVPSILKGDDRFLPLAAGAITEIVNAATSGPPARAAKPAAATEHLTVELAATLLPDALEPALGNRAGLSFARRPGGLTSRYTSIPGLNDTGDPLASLTDGRVVKVVSSDGGAPSEVPTPPSVQLQRMALAARATSAFPGAFEPAPVQSIMGPPADGVRLTPEGDPTALGWWSWRIYRMRERLRIPRTNLDRLTNSRRVMNMHPVFTYARGARAGAARTASSPAAHQPAVPVAKSPTGTTDLGRPREVFNVVDGGVFDNIPIDRAVRAIQRSATDQPSERYLVYLDPQPPAPVYPTSSPPPNAPDRADHGDRSTPTINWLRGITESRALQKRTETAADERHLVDKYNANSAAVEGRLAALAGVPLAALKRQSIDGYFAARVGRDTDLLTDFLRDPQPWYSAPPFGAVAVLDLSETDVSSLSCDLASAYKDADAKNCLGKGDIQAAIDAVMVMIAWVRWRETFDATDETGAVKRRLYRWLTLLYYYRRETVFRQLMQPGGTPGDEPPSLSKRLAKGLVCQNEVMISQAEIDATRDESVAGDAALFIALAPASPPPNSTRPPTIGPLLLHMWPALDDLLASIREWPISVQSVSSPSIFTSVHSSDIDAVGLARLFLSIGIPGSATRIRYFEITGDTRADGLEGLCVGPAEDRVDLEPLREAAIQKQVESWVRKNADLSRLHQQISDDVKATRELSRADIKLAGTDLARFAGFLNSRWRENDWYWGRLDAATRVPALLQRSSGRDETPPSSDAVTRLILQEADCRGYRSRPTDDPLSSRLERVGGESLANLSATYKFALISRALPLIARGLQPETGSGGVVVNVLKWIVAVVLRLVIAVASLVADPLRLIAALAVGLTAAALLGPSPASIVEQRVFAGLLLVVGVVMAWLGFMVWRRWRRVVRGFATVRPGNTEWSDVIGASRRRAAKRYVAAMVGGVVIVVLSIAFGLVWPQAWRQVGWEFMVLLVAAAALLTWWLYWRSVSAQPHRRPPPGRIGTLIATGVLYAMAAVATSITPSRDADSSPMSCSIHLAEATARQGLWTSRTLIVVLAVVALTLVSFWGWTPWYWLLSVSALLIGAAIAVVKLLDSHGCMESGFVDLLPFVIWLVGVGLLQQCAIPLSTDLLTATGWREWLRVRQDLLQRIAIDCRAWKRAWWPPRDRPGDLGTRG
ncbi:DUF3376 domain-containing protein [Gordonia sp. NPDC003424]